MKKTILSLMLLLLATTMNAQTILKGDMNDDGQVTISDVTSVVNVILGKSPVETINVGGSPYAVDNSMVVGTWYAPDGTHFTLNEDESTDYTNSVTYKFMPMLGRILFYGTNGKATTVVGVAEMTADYLLILDYTTGSLTYYTKSTSLNQVTGVTLSQTSIGMNSGTTRQLSATVSPSSAFNQEVAWTSSDENVATVDQNGLVTAIAGGSCIIKATSTDGSGVSSTCSVSVTQMVTSIALSQTFLVLELDEFVRLTATVLPDNAANKAVTWSSSNENVATVRSGRVDAYDFGDAVITCEAADGSGVVATCMVLIVEDKNSYGELDGHIYVDLGLPSGTLWATCNIGASSPEEYGDYFAWGETEGYKSGKSNFDWSTYKWCNGSDTTMTKYCINSTYGYNGFTDNKTELDPEDDAAYVNWGSGWRMPTKTQLQELFNSAHTTTEWTTMNGVNGSKIMSKTNGNCLFLPAAGFWDGTSLLSEGLYGDYWSRMQIFSEYSTPIPTRAWRQTACSNVQSGESHRSCGITVRPVRNQ